MREIIVDALRTVFGEEVYRRQRKWRELRKKENRHWRGVTGVIHVGANTGQERVFYDKLRLDVIWIEPIPAVFKELTFNIAAFPKQRAYQYLVTDVDGCKYKFHIANNNGVSSSILALSKHKEMWPDVSYSDCIELRSTTLSSLVKKERIDIRGFQGLILDTQGSELMVLKGAGDLLQAIRFVKAEVADYEAYENCCLVGELSSFMAEHGFREERRDIQRSIEGLGTYYDILYCRRAKNGSA